MMIRLLIAVHVVVASLWRILYWAWRKLLSRREGDSNG